MKSNPESVPALGFLRSALLLLALLNLLPPLFELIVGGSDAEGGWSVVSGIVAPVTAPLLLVGLLFDYIMSRVRAADAEGAERERFTRVARIELAMIALSLLIWIPFFTIRLG